MKILVVEDDVTLGEQVVAGLEQNGWVAEHSIDGIDALYRATSEPWDAIVLDLGLPKLDGITVLKGIREENVNCPVVILSARNELTQRVDGLNAGADDYLTKPFQMVELVARVRAQLRRATGNVSPVIQAGDLSLDTRTSKVTWQDNVIDLTALEFKVLSYLMHNTDKVISRTELVEHIYKQDFDRDSNTIEVFIGRIRRKIGNDVIKTVRGLGYRINAN
ncbi:MULTISPECIES: response regulator transcription factor [Photobacterium]|uniref:Response regulator transcription factor n=1 Tax=Photobacterium piscicola TaxID=1378299 RepID=A0A1T5HWJ2_9GAMM|nr:MULTISPECIES: response regulator transcription factor [Photobacterium]MEC6823713.1 response regulator transcription factor [Photobacterium piscicola]MEC6882093.1 response regulator transcription factor [Photobacterium piscicola]MEC6899584.1 response regulator transcription factor [Photobacterium piscicola]PST94347.1 DNA-binding response regulator [Photobacterium sp. NCIMB 13483]SKC31221.1 Transcriptional regulatory protein QseB [Photobacterium piscicola]